MFATETPLNVAKSPDAEKMPRQRGIYCLTAYLSIPERVSK